MKFALLSATFFALLATGSANAATVTAAFMTTAQANSDCTAGGAQVTSFPNTAAAAWLYLYVSSAKAGDRTSVDFLDPSGQSRSSISFSSLPSDGSYCFSANLNIAGTAAAGIPGNWSARVTYNGSTLTSVPFSITGGSTGNCVYAVNPQVIPMTAAGGSGSITVSTTSTCQWTATSNATSFVTITSGASGTGNGTVNYSVTANNTTSARSGTLTVAGTTVTVNQAAGTGCAYALNPPSATVPGAGGSGTFAVGTGSTCTWTATPNSNWISITSGSSGTGNGTVAYSATANTATTTRTGTITVNGQTFVLTQQAAGGTGTTTCNFSNGFADKSALTLVGDAATVATNDGTILRVSPAKGGQSGAAYCTSPVALGNNGTFSTQFQFRFTNPGGWDPADGITFVLGTSTTGLGSGGVGIGYAGVSGKSFAVEFDTYNNGGADNNSSNHVAIDTNGSLSSTNIVNVYNNASCGLKDGSPAQNDYTVNGCMANGHLWTVNISYDGSKLNVSLIDPSIGTTFNAISNYAVDLASLLGQSNVYVGFTSGTGSGWENHDIVNWAFSNTTSLAGCNYSLTTSSATAPAAGGSGSFGLTASASTCTWSATSDATWLHLTSAANGTGSTLITYTVDANTGTNRTGHITVGGQVYTVTQTGSGSGSCTYTLSPTSANPGAAAGTGSFSVATGSACTWTASPNANWISITSGSPGTGNGTVNYSVSANTGTTSRTGTISVADQTFTITQAAPSGCSYTLNPTSATVPVGGGTGSISVTAATGCTWTATPGATWVSITSGGNGNGNGTVNYSAQGNTGSGRNTTISIGDATFTLSQAASPISPTSGIIGYGPGVGVYTLNRIEVTRSYAGALDLTPANTTNNISPGTKTYPAATTSFQAGWDFMWGGTPPPNKNKFIETVNLTAVPQTVTPDVNYTISATALGDWSATGYGNSRNHIYKLDDGFSGAQQSPITGGTTDGNPSVTGNSSINMSYTRPAPAALNGEVRIPVTAFLTFNGDGDAGTGRMEIDLVYSSCASTSVTPPSQQPPASGGTLSVPVSATSGCTWNATVMAGSSWLTASPTSGSSSATVTLTAAANTGSTYRGAVVNIAGYLVAVTQAPASTSGTYTLSRIDVSRSANTPSNAGLPIPTGKQSFPAGSLLLSYQNGWENTSAADIGGNPLVAAVRRLRFVGFVNLDGVPGGVTPGSPTTVAAGMYGDWIAAGYGIARFHTLALSGAVTGSVQSPKNPPDNSGNPNGIGVLNLTGASGPAFNAPAPDAKGELHIPLYADFNFEDAGAANITLDLVYTGGGSTSCTYSLTSSTTSVPNTGGSGSFNMTASATSCTWNAGSDASWLHVTSASSGSGSTTVAYTADANTTTSTRTGHIAIGGQTFTVTQPGTTLCTYTLDPTSASASAAGGTGSFNVTAPAGCSWNAIPNVPWITIGSRSGGGGAANINLIRLVGGAYSAAGGFADNGQVWTTNYGSWVLGITNPSVGSPILNDQTDRTVNLSPGTYYTYNEPTGFGTAVNVTVRWTDNRPEDNAVFNVGPFTPATSWSRLAGASNLSLSSTGLLNENRIGPGLDPKDTKVDNVLQLTIAGAGGSSGTSNGSVTYTVAANTGPARTGTISVGGQTFTVNQAGGSTVCTYTLNPTSSNAPAAGATVTVGVIAGSNCKWTATSNVSWLMLTSGGSGSGNGTVQFTVQANITTSSRTGTVTIGGQTYTVTQDAAPACVYSLAPTGASSPYGGGTASFNVIASAAYCTWTATSNAAFLSITSTSSGTGTGPVGYSVAPNTNTSSRTGTITVAGQTFTLTQAAAPPPPCTYTLSPTAANAPAAGTTGSFSVVTSGSTCQWSATSNASWINVTGTANGTGNGNLNFTVGPNTGPARTGTITVSGQTFTITQDAGASPCSYTLNPTSQSAFPAGGPGQVIVMPSQSSCTWTATSNNPEFLSITSSANGSGTAVINYNVAANSSANERNGSLTIGNVNFPVKQSGGTPPTCTLTLNPSSETATSAGGSGQVSVTTATGCTWRVTPNASWITITKSGSGNGSDTVTYNVDANSSTAPRDGTITIGTQTFTLHQQAGTPAPCTYLLNPTSQSATVTGGPGSFTVTTANACTWTATSNSPNFLTVTSGTGNGNGAVNYTVAQNTTGSSRNGTITVGGQTFTITQPGVTPPNPCQYSLNPTSQSATSSGGPAQVTITTSTGCAWQASSSNPDWITITTGATGAGSGLVSYSIQPNTTNTTRNGSMTIGGISFPVTQPGVDAGPCTYSLSPTSQSAAATGGPGQIAVNTTTGCSWQPTTTDAWLTITSGGSGAGSGTVSYNVAPNTSTLSRTGTITIGGIAFTVTQSGANAPAPNCSSLSISPTSQAAQPGGGTSQFTVTAPAGCPWTAITNNSDWLTITNGGSGNGNGTVTYSVAPYTGTTPRTGTVTVGNQTFSVTQAAAAAPCSYSFNPTSQQVGGAGGPGNFIVTTNTGCTWNAASDSDWLTISTGATGNGSGLLNYSVAPYPSGSGRTGNITIAGQNFPVTQSSGAGQTCSYTLSPTSQTATAAAGTGQVAVTAQTGCTWNATSSVDWITISAGANGNGSGTLSYSVAANTGASRSATITVATGVTFTLNQDAGNGTAAPTPCSLTLSSASHSATVSGGASAFTVTAPVGCTWTATTNNADFLTVTNSGSGAGNGVVAYSVAPNSGTAPRSGTITINGGTVAGNQTFTLNQAGTSTQGAVPCVFTLNRTSGSATNDAGSAQVQVTGPVGCAWSATSNHTDWLTITGGASGDGSGVVTYAFTANPAAARNGTILIAGLTFPVTQSGAGSTGTTPGNCQYSLSPTSQSVRVGGGPGQFTVNAASGCTWTATPTADWISATSGGSGNGGGTVTFNVQANANASSRNGTITVANQTFQIAQDGTGTTTGACSLSLDPSSQNATSGGGNAQVNVTTSVGCPWTATSTPDWISIVAGASGNGNGSFSYSVQANPNTTARSGTVNVSGVTFTVNQAAKSAGGATSLVGNCSYTIAPTSQSATAAGGSGQIKVSSSVGCSWTTTSSVDWLTVTNAGSGTANGTVTYAATANNGPDRTGTLIVAGQTFTLTQPGTSSNGGTGGSACTYSATPSNQTASSAGGASTIVVAAPVGCQWTATASADWLSITTGASGAGNGTVNYNAAANAGAASRAGSISIAGQTVTITQAAQGAVANGCTYSLSPSSQLVTSSGGSGQAALAASAGCSWTATVSDTFVTLSSTTGTGNSAIAYTVASNPGAASRSATITVAGQTLTITQAAQGANGDACTYSLNPSNLSQPGAGGSGQVAVTAQVGCSWLATSGSDWLSIIDSGTGQGSGVVTFGAAANSTGATRTGTITVGGQTLTVNQDASTITPGGPTIAAGAVVNAASFAKPDTPGGTIGQGSFFTIFGSNIGPGTPAGVLAFPLGTTLGGVSIKVSQGSMQVDAIPHFVSAGQVNAILPSNAPTGTVQLTLTYNGQTSNAVNFQVTPTGWGTFTNPAGGTGQGIIQNVVSPTQYDLNTTASSAKPGQTEILWGTGLGPITAADNMPPPVGNLPIPVQVTVGGVPAQVGYSGRTPCCAAVDNVYFTVPPGAPLGCAVPVKVILNGQDIYNTVTMAISQNGGQCPTN